MRGVLPCAAAQALAKNGEYIGERYVRLLHVPKSEMEEQVRLGTLAIPGAAAKLRSRLLRQQQQQQQRVVGLAPAAALPAFMHPGGLGPQLFLPATPLRLLAVPHPRQAWASRKASHGWRQTHLGPLVCGVRRAPVRAPPCHASLRVQAQTQRTILAAPHPALHSTTGMLGHSSVPEGMRDQRGDPAIVAVRGARADSLQASEAQRA